jgi:hypothetical protein
LTAADIKQALADGGVARAEVDQAWPGVQRKLRSHDRVRVDSRTYRLTFPPVSAEEALELLSHGRLPAAQKPALLDILRAALAEPSEEDLEEEARRRQSDIDAVRALAELASEAEELAVNEARPEALIHRLRARVKRSGLEPIGRAGDETAFDRKRHKPIGGAIRDGAPVVVVRPGYVWKAPTEDVLITKAVVEE